MALIPKDVALIQRENEALSQSLKQVMEALSATLPNSSNPKPRPKKALPPKRTIN